MKIKIIFFNFFLIIILFLVGDIIFSNFIYKNNVGHKCYEISDDGKFYKLQKNCYAKMRILSSINSFKVYTNNNGNRFSDSSNNFSNKNIYFIGDSHTFGLGSNWKDTFVGIIESKKKNYKTINLGVPSYSPSVFYYLLDELHQKKKLDKDKIFVLIDITDVADESIRWRNSLNKIKPFLSSPIIEKKNTGFKKFKRQNLKASHIIATFLREKGRNLRKNIGRKQKKEDIDHQIRGAGTWPGRFTFTNFAELEGCNVENTLNNPWSCGGVNRGLGKIKEKMDNFGKLVKLSNSEFYIIVFPWAETLNFGQDVFNWENYIKELCKTSECKKVINLFPEFKEIKNTRKDWLKYLFLSDDFHLTPAGHKILAEKILREAF